MLGSETAETNLRTLLQPCYLQLLGVAVGERDCGDESADAAVTMLFATVGRRCWKRDCGDESVDAAVTMLFAAVGGRCWGARHGGNESADGAVTMLFAAVGGRCWGARHGGNESADGAVTMLFATVGVDLLCDTLAADDAGVRLLCDILLRTLLVGGCCCVIKGSKIWTPYFLHLNGCCCAIPCCGWCWARTFAARSAAADAAV